MAKLNWERASQHDKGYLYRGEASFLGRNTAIISSGKIKAKSKHCTSIKKNGEQCGGGCKKGFDVCGPHLDQRRR